MNQSIQLRHRRRNNMTTQAKKKLTLTELIQQKEKYQVKTDAKEEIYLDQLDATITISKPERSLVIEAIEMKEEGDPFLVYNVVVEPNLKDSELQKAYGCAEPTDIVHKIFDEGTIAGIAKASLKLAGWESEVKTVENLKN